MEDRGGLFEILAKIEAKPGIYIGHRSVSDLFIFIAGYKTARRELGIEPTERELAFYRDFNEFVQNRDRVRTSNSWAKIIMLGCADEQQGFDRFFELLAEFEAQTQTEQAIPNNLIEL